MKKTTLEDLLRFRQREPYQSQYEYIRDLIGQGKIRPVKASPLNGKTPSLHQTYWVAEEEKDNSVLLEELLYAIPTQITTDYYRKHLAVYEREQKWVKALGTFLQRQAQKDSSVMEAISLNERSFQIFGREKFLQKEQGRTVLKHCGVSIEQLNVYGTTEPLSYYSRSRKVPQTILIIENKDTFYSMRRFLMEDGDRKILGVPVETLVYGAGKGILRSMEDFIFCVEPYMRDKRNQYLYFGDLDYEGIGIYEGAEALFMEEYELRPFVRAYQKMIQKAEAVRELPETREGQNRNITGKFFSYFDAKDKSRMEQILEEDKYIPQEILNITDL